MSGKPAPHCDARGFATLTAIALVALVAVAMAAAAAVFRLDVRRTAAAVDDAQLRQMLLAGERAARARLDARAGAPAAAAGEAVALPPPLAAAGATLRISIAPDAAGAAATVEAALAGRAAAQTLRYERGPGGWRLASAELTRHAPGPAPAGASSGAGSLRTDRAVPKNSIGPTGGVGQVDRVGG
jgi:hypothetical protein